MSWSAEPVMLKWSFCFGRKRYASHGLTLDYEANTTLSIRVRVKDEHDAAVEGIFVVTVTDLNDRPENLLAVRSLSISENQPVGTPVGNFNAIDQDATHLGLRIGERTGGSDNGLFTLETNGTLRTATTLDFESNASTYCILVRRMNTMLRSRVIFRLTSWT